MEAGEVAATTAGVVTAEEEAIAATEETEAEAEAEATLALEMEAEMEDWASATGQTVV